MCKASNKNGAGKSMAGFTLTEAVFAMLIMMIVGLSTTGLFLYSIRYNSGAHSRTVASALAQQRMEALRNTTFSNLTAGTTTESSVASANRTFSVVTTITAEDLVTTANAPGPERKRITIQVTPLSSSIWAGGTVTLFTVRSVERAGPNRAPNS